MPFTRNYKPNKHAYIQQDNLTTYSYRLPDMLTTLCRGYAYLRMHYIPVCSMKTAIIVSVTPRTPVTWQPLFDGIS